MMGAATTSCPEISSYRAGSTDICDVCPNQFQIIDSEGESHLLCRLGEE